jgi:glycerate kinase
MTFLIALDSFKDYKSSIEICDQLASSISALAPDVQVLQAPLADGGEGSLATINYYRNLEIIEVPVLDPIGRPIMARCLLDTDHQEGYVSMSEASGLELLAQTERNCYHTSTYGTGQLIAALLDRGMEKLHLFVGGSATSDAGIGMLAALGATVVSAGKHRSHPVGNDLMTLDRIDIPASLHNLTTVVYTDVDNQLYGLQGAAIVYGPQKGATPGQILELDRGLERFALIAKDHHSKDVCLPGSGAAGGIVAGALLAFDTSIASGAAYFCDLAGLADKIEQADCIITGEGHLDDQTLSGKLVSKVCAMAKNKMVIALCGKSSMTASDQASMGIDHVISLSEIDPSPEPGKLSESLHLVPEHILSIVDL